MSRGVGRAPAGLVQQRGQRAPHRAPLPAGGQRDAGAHRPDSRPANVADAARGRQGKGRCVSSQQGARPSPSPAVQRSRNPGACCEENAQSVGPPSPAVTGPGPSGRTGAERPDGGRGSMLLRCCFTPRAICGFCVLQPKSQLAVSHFFFLEETVESILKFEWKYRRPGQARATAKRGTDTVGRRTSDSGHCDQTVAAVEAARPQTKGGRSIDAREQRVPKKSRVNGKLGFARDRRRGRGERLSCQQTLLEKSVCRGEKAPNLTPCTTIDSRWLADSVKLKTRKLPAEKLERIFVLLGKDYLEATANG